MIAPNINYMNTENNDSHSNGYTKNKIYDLSDDNIIDHNDFIDNTNHNLLTLIPTLS